MSEIGFCFCVITESVPALHRTHEDVAAAAIRGGATMIQFRDKTASNEQFTAMASKLLRMTRAAGIPLIVNDRVSIAVALRADGVHIGRDDGDPLEVRRALPAGMCLGISASNYDDALAMSRAGADYLGVGPVFPTVSKADAAPSIGTAELATICRAVGVPVVAIGGIDQSNLQAIRDAGASGIAMISAVTRAKNMETAAQELRSEWQTVCDETRSKELSPRTNAEVVSEVGPDRAV